jgi:photosystem II stability/assembly factor-like uncharacterized protein
VGAAGTILHTGDGGANWEKQKSPVNYYHMAVHFMTPLKGFAASERTHILATTDGGKTWSVQFAHEDFILKSISFCDDRHAWAVGEFGYTYYTQDAGEHWENQGGYYDLDPETGNLVGDPFLFDVAAIDPQTAWAVGIQGIVKVTRDGGKTWKKVDVGVPPVPLYCIEYDGSNTLMIGGKGVCLLSLDMGASWQKVDFQPPIKYGWIYQLARLGKDALAAACGDGGLIYLKTSRNGHHDQQTQPLRHLTPFGCPRPRAGRDRRFCRRHDPDQGGGPRL